MYAAVPVRKSSIPLPLVVSVILNPCVCSVDLVAIPPEYSVPSGALIIPLPVKNVSVVLVAGIGLP